MEKQADFTKKRIFFAYMYLNVVLDDLDKGKKFYLLIGRGPPDLCILCT